MARKRRYAQAFQVNSRPALESSSTMELNVLVFLAQ